MNEIIIVGPPGCLDADTVMLFRQKGVMVQYKISTAYAIFGEFPLLLDTLSVLDGNAIGPNRVERIVYSGEKEVFLVTDSDGFSLAVTAKHPFLTPCGEYVPLEDLREQSEIMVGMGTKVVPSKIASIVFIGIRKTYDLVMKAPYHNYIAQNFAVHNTGKSTQVIRQMEVAIRKYGPDKVMLCSLTKAAAAELKSRDSSVNPEMIGTLHAHAFRGLGRPRLAEVKEGISSWNENHPMLKITSSAASPDSDDQNEGASEGQGRGDELMQKINLLRAKCIPQERWPAMAQEFFEKWCDWKNLSERLDFADLIDEAYSRLLVAPGAPEVIFADEAQDLSRAEHRLLTRWASKAKSFVVVGDPDQSLFHWRGSDPEVMNIKRVPEENVRILSQSYRVPAAVHTKALELINSIQARNRVEYQPTGTQGFVSTSTATYQDLAPVEDMILEYLESGKRVMFLASCAYMLNPVIGWLKSKGIPYGNPYSSRWNPMGAKGITKALQLYDYLTPCAEYSDSPAFWTKTQLKTALHGIKSTGVLKRGWKKKLDEVSDDLPSEQFAVFVRGIFEPEGLAKFLSFDLDWYKSNFNSAMEFPVNIVRKFGRDALVRLPKVTVGTIHSVKGGESEIVFLFPDLSYQGFLQYGQAGFGGRDAIKRMFYVGMTRAREGLVLCKSQGNRYVKL